MFARARRPSLHHRPPRMTLAPGLIQHLTLPFFFLYGIPIKITIKYNQASSEAVFSRAIWQPFLKKEGLPAIVLTFHMSKRCADSASVLEITAVGGPLRWLTHGMENRIAGCQSATVYTATAL